jgi:type IV pilus assembly protein PilC
MQQSDLKTFTYTGRDRYKKRVKGELKAKSLFDAKAELRGKKVTQVVVHQVREKPKAKGKVGQKSALDIQITWGPFGNISNKELLIFTKKLTTMTRSGLPILDSLQLVQGQIPNAVFKNVVQDVINSINAGSSLSEAVGKHPRYFDQIYRNMIEAGEMTGKLDSFLERIVYSLERMETIRTGIKSALFYPVTLVVVTLLIVYFMLTKVVPTFVQMYAGIGAKLPAPTQMIVDASDWILNGTNVLKVIGLVFAIYMFHNFLMKAFYPYRKSLNLFALKLPLFGPIIIKSTVARMSLLMANLFAAGIGINEILRVAASTSTNLVFIEAQERIAERVVTGTELSVLFEEEDAFPIELSQLIRVGERTGGMEEMLSSIAKYYQEEFEATVKGLTTMIEPLMIVFVGMMIGLLVVALYLPIFSAGDVFKGG